MKTTILILFLAIGSSLYAQGETDTIPVILLVCDTTDQGGITWVDLSDSMSYVAFQWRFTGGRVYGKEFTTHWEYGYEVVELPDLNRRYIVGTGHNYEFVSGDRQWQHVKYLSSNKKELNKVVWLSKERKVQ
jgi:hypothetical protein